MITRQTAVGSGSNGTYHVPLHRPVRLEPGTYWLSVRANMSFSVGQWGWEVVSQATGSVASWKNPGDGFGTGCTTYTDMQTCFGGSAPGPDFMFSVNRTRLRCSRRGASY